MEDLNPAKIRKTDNGDRGGKGPRGSRGGLQRRFRILEPNLQPTDITEKMGNIGKTVKLASNFAKFSISQVDTFYMYDVVLSDMGIAPKGKLKIISKVKETNDKHGPFCFDGRRLFTGEKWHGESDIQEFTEDDKKITIRFITNVTAGTEEYYQMVNVMFNNIQVFMGQERIGRAYFLGANTDKRDIAKGSGPTYFEVNNFRVLGGFSTTLQRGTRPDGSSSTLLYIERINRVLNENSVVNAYSKGRSDQLIGRDVITKYNNKTYRISDIKEMSVGDQFDLAGRKLSYYDYFKERYNIKLQHSNQPFVLTRMRRTVPRKKKPENPEEASEEAPKEPPAEPEPEMTLNIPGELCFLCGFSDQEKSNMDLQKNLGGILKREPRQRLDDIPAFCDWIGKSEKATSFMKEWSLRVENRPLEIEGRELPPVDVVSGGQKMNERIPDDWKFGRVNFATSSRKSHEIDIVVMDRNDFNYQKFIQDVKNELRNLNVNAKVTSVEKCAPNDIENLLTDIMRRSRDAVKMALVFVPDDKAYARVKNFTLTTGLLTQCVTQRNGTNRVDKRRQVVASKSVMQIFSKFGYDPWNVEIKLRPTMIVGLDTYHSKTGKKSIQASVYSINSTFTQYLSFINSPRGRQEFHEVLGRNFAAALQQFHSKYEIYPQRIMIYRDGVGDSQMFFTKQFEADALKPIMEKLYQDKGFPIPQIIYVVVKKRISTKFFKNGANPEPGTIVDKEIVKPNFYEFFLVSQRTTKGTASPTNYNVLEDTKLLTKKGSMEPMAPNELQKITYTLTHLYFNWMGTIRVPAPTHYAHRLAELIGKIHKGTNPAVINDRIRDRLFYL